MEYEDYLHGSLLQEVLQHTSRIEAFIHTHVSTKYMISTLGRLMRTDTCRFKKPCVSKAGYHSYGMNDKKAFSQQAHRLVAHAFLPNPLQHPTVDHIDCDPRNNRLDNLRWATHTEQANNKTGYIASTMPLGLYIGDELIATYASREEFEITHDISLRNRPTGLRGQSLDSNGLVGHILRAISGNNLSSEEWRALISPNKPLRDGYMVSNLGRVKLIRRKTYGFDTSDGYKYVALQKKDATTFTTMLVHRLVAYVFLGIPENYANLVVNHKDGNKTNNVVTNLEWATYSENTQHSANVVNTHVLRPVASYDQRSGKLIQTYASIKKAADDVGKTASSIQAAAQKGGLIADRFWRYIKRTPLAKINLDAVKKTNKQRVAQYNQHSGSLVKVYDSFTEAAREMKLDVGNLIKSASKKKSTCGFIWAKVPHGDVPSMVDLSEFTIAGKYRRSAHIKDME